MASAWLASTRAVGTPVRLRLHRLDLLLIWCQFVGQVVYSRSATNRTAAEFENLCLSTLVEENIKRNWTELNSASLDERVESSPFYTVKTSVYPPIFVASFHNLTEPVPYTFVYVNRRAPGLAFHRENAVLHTVEQFPGFYQGPVNQHWLFQTFTEDVSVCAILVHAAH